MTLPRGTGFCKKCERRILLATNGKLVPHSNNPKEPQSGRVRCPGSLTRLYDPGPDKETP